MDIKMLLTINAQNVKRGPKPKMQDAFYTAKLYIYIYMNLQRLKQVILYS